MKAPSDINQEDENAQSALIHNGYFLHDIEWYLPSYTRYYEPTYSNRKNVQYKACRLVQGRPVCYASFDHDDNMEEEEVPASDDDDELVELADLTKEYREKTTRHPVQSATIYPTTASNFNKHFIPPQTRKFDVKSFPLSMNSIPITVLKKKLNRTLRSIESKFQRNEFDTWKYLIYQPKDYHDSDPRYYTTMLNSPYNYEDDLGKSFFTGKQPRSVKTKILKVYVTPKTNGLFDQGRGKYSRLVSLPVLHGHLDQAKHQGKPGKKPTGRVYDDDANIDYVWGKIPKDIPGRTYVENANTAHASGKLPKGIPGRTYFENTNEIEMPMEVKTDKWEQFKALEQKEKK